MTPACQWRSHADLYLQNFLAGEHIPLLPHLRRNEVEQRHDAREIHESVSDLT